MTEHERAVLNWRNRNSSPEAWFDHLVGQFGEERATAMLREKVAQHEAEYLAAKARFGEDFKHGRQREREERLALGEPIIPNYLKGD